MKNLLYIGNQLSGKGSTVTTIEELGKRLEAEGYRVVLASSVHNKLLRMLHMVYVFICNARKTEVVLIDTYSTFNFYYALIIATGCRMFKIPYIPILHGGNLEGRLKNSAKSAYTLFHKAFVNVAPSGFMEALFTRYGYQNLTYIPNPLEVSAYPFKQRAGVRCKLLWVRSFAGLYNPLMALKVVQALENYGYKPELCMVGPDKDGSLQQCTTYAEKHGLNVTFTGRLPKNEWIDLSKEYDIFINTTTVDNTPLSVLEAMALGLPVVSTNVGGMPYMVTDKETGFLVGSDDVAGMAQKIVTLLNNPEMAGSLSLKGRAYTEQLDWSAAAVKWNNLLQRI